MRVSPDTKNDQSEKVAYNMADFPAYIQKRFLSSYPNYSAISHWHDDIELVRILSGHMHYSINGRSVLLNEKEGIFVNTRQFHYGYSKDDSECIFICILLHPLLLCSSHYIEQNYILPVIQNESLPYLVLHENKMYEKELLNFADEMYQSQLSELYALKIQSLFFQAWESLFLLSSHTEAKPASRSQHLTILKDMVDFIFKNYTERITLEEISWAGKVGKTTCCAIFKKYTNETPISYLINYRLKKGVELLLTTDKTVSEICFEIGFSGASYFTETFRKFFGCTPSEYRIDYLQRDHKV